MARSLRQSKILEIISTKEVETQDELVAYLRAANFDITQATISRDIKELGLIKVIGSEGKYKYAIVDSNQGISNKNINIFKELVISVKPAQNLCVIKTLKGMASGICAMMDKLNLSNVMGAVNGDDTVMVIFPNIMSAEQAVKTLQDMLIGY